MCHIVARHVRHAVEEFYQPVKCNEIFCFYGYGDKHYEELCIGEQHAECQKYAEYSPRRPYCIQQCNILHYGYCYRCAVYGGYCYAADAYKGYEPYEFLYYSRSYTCGNVIYEKPLRTPDCFQRAAEDKYGEHVEKDMPDRRGIVHEHICDELDGVEIVGRDIVKPQIIGKRKRIAALQHYRRQPYYKVYYYQIFGNRRNTGKKRTSERHIL